MEVVPPFQLLQPPFFWECSPLDFGPWLWGLMPTHMHTQEHKRLGKAWCEVYVSLGLMSWALWTPLMFFPINIGKSCLYGPHFVQGALSYCNQFGLGFLVLV